MLRNTIEYKLTWNILIDTFREIVESKDFEDVTTYNNAIDTLESLSDENLAYLVVENTPENIQHLSPIDTIYNMNTRAVTRVVMDFKENELFNQFFEKWKELENKITPDQLRKFIENESKKILDMDLYIKDVPILPDNKFNEDDILKYIELYKNNKVPFFYEIEEIYQSEKDEKESFNFEDIDEPSTDEPPTDRRLPLFKTQKDFLPLNLFQDPQELNKQLKDQFQQKNFSEYAKAKHIDVPYLIGTDNINRLYNNNKLQSELRNGTLNNKDRIKQWHKDKRLALLNKYNTYKEPIKIKHPFNN